MIHVKGVTLNAINCETIIWQYSSIISPAKKCQ